MSHLYFIHRCIHGGFYLEFIKQWRFLKRSIFALILFFVSFYLACGATKNSVVFLVAVGFLDLEGSDLITKIGEGTNIVAGYGVDELMRA